jgi:hypothetical protein
MTHSTHAVSIGNGLFAQVRRPETILEAYRRLQRTCKHQKRDTSCSIERAKRSKRHTKTTSKAFQAGVPKPAVGTEPAPSVLCQNIRWARPCSPSWVRSAQGLGGFGCSAENPKPVISIAENAEVNPVRYPIVQRSDIKWLWNAENSPFSPCSTVSRKT